MAGEATDEFKEIARDNLLILEKDRHEIINNRAVVLFESMESQIYPLGGVSVYDEYDMDSLLDLFELQEHEPDAIIPICDYLSSIPIAADNDDGYAYILIANIASVLSLAAMSETEAAKKNVGRI